MIIDCHGHYTTAPKALDIFRRQQIDALRDGSLARRVWATTWETPRPAKPGQPCATN